MSQEKQRETVDIELIMQRRREIFALASQYGLPAFREVEPPGGYEMTGQAGELVEGVEFEIPSAQERAS